METISASARIAQQEYKHNHDLAAAALAFNVAATRLASNAFYYEMEPEMQGTLAIRTQQRDQARAEYLALRAST